MSHLIIELSEADEWPARLGAKHIPERRRPTMLQPSREVAEQEALRLAARHPGRRFVVLAPVAQATTIQVATHITLGGKVVAERAQPVLADIKDPDDDVPF